MHIYERRGHGFADLDGDLVRTRIRFLDEHLLNMADRDADGLEDVEEAQHGSDPHAFDSDGDGQRDGDEVDAGTSPSDPLSSLRIAHAELDVGVDNLGTISLAGRDARPDDVLEYAGALSNVFTEWHEVTSQRHADGLSASASIDEIPHGYLRLRRPDSMAASNIVGWRRGTIERSAQQPFVNHLGPSFVGRTIHQAIATAHGEMVTLPGLSQVDVPAAATLFATVARDPERALGATDPDVRMAEGHWWRIVSIAGDHLTIESRPDASYPVPPDGAHIAVIVRPSLAHIFRSGVGLQTGDRIDISGDSYELAGDATWRRDRDLMSFSPDEIQIDPTQGFVLHATGGAATDFISAGFVPDGDMVAYVDGTALVSFPYAEPMRLDRLGFGRSGLSHLQDDVIHVNDRTLPSYAGDEQAIPLNGETNPYELYWEFAGNDLWRARPHAAQVTPYSQELYSRYEADPSRTDPHHTGLGRLQVEPTRALLITSSQPDQPRLREWRCRGAHHRDRHTR